MGKALPGVLSSPRDKAGEGDRKKSQGWSKRAGLNTCRRGGDDASATIITLWAGTGELAASEEEPPLGDGAGTCQLPGPRWIHPGAAEDPRWFDPCTGEFTKSFVVCRRYRSQTAFL